MARIKTAVFTVVLYAHIALLTPYELAAQGRTASPAQWCASAGNSGGTDDGKMRFRFDTLMKDGEAEFVLRGNAILCFAGYAVAANEIIFDHQTDRLRASGSVSVDDPNGNTTRSESIIFGEPISRAFADAVARQKK